jgi:hypothetical protein
MEFSLVALLVGGVSKIETMHMSPVRLKSEKGCAGKKLKITDPTSRQRGRSTSKNPKLSKKGIEN